MKSKLFYRITMAANTAILIAGPVILSLFIGLWLDNTFKTSPFFAMAGGLLGFAGSVISLLKLLKTMK